VGGGVVGGDVIGCTPQLISYAFAGVFAPARTTTFDAFRALHLVKIKKPVVPAHPILRALPPGEAHCSIHPKFGELFGCPSLRS
jgi:hypothetical protein